MIDYQHRKIFLKVLTSAFYLCIFAKQSNRLLIIKIKHYD